MKLAADVNSVAELKFAAEDFMLAAESKNADDCRLFMDLKKATVAKVSPVKTASDKRKEAAGSRAAAGFKALAEKSAAAELAAVADRKDKVAREAAAVKALAKRSAAAESISDADRIAGEAASALLIAKRRQAEEKMAAAVALSAVEKGVPMMLKTLKDTLKILESYPSLYSDL